MWRSCHSWTLIHVMAREMKWCIPCSLLIVHICWWRSLLEKIITFCMLPMPNSQSPTRFPFSGSVVFLLRNDLVWCLTFSISICRPCLLCSSHCSNKSCFCTLSALLSKHFYPFCLKVFNFYRLQPFTGKGKSRGNLLIPLLHKISIAKVCCCLAAL